ncbi:MAG: thiamine-phosphate kinase, partial [Nitrosomonadales bacterium]|nr:thiamine-phosphate kinase [Nitrosomonadales bacterium]
LVQVRDGQVLAVSSDMLVSGTHFFPDADPFLLGHKTLAVNLSDLAAMGATPRWATLAIALPAADAAWLERFSAGFFALAQLHGVELIGGDTTRGPLNLCVTIFGEVPGRQALRRSGAQLDDEIWVSGKLGDAALALAHLQGRIELSAEEYAACAPALHQPNPRVALGLALRGIANSAIDISDGLAADLGHILEESHLAARLDYSALPVSPMLRKYLQNPTAKQCAWSGGDDYELCFTVPLARRSEVLRIASHLDLPLTCIGKIVAGSGYLVHDADGNPLNLEATGYDHFR